MSNIQRRAQNLLDVFRDPRYDLHGHGGIQTAIEIIEDLNEDLERISAERERSQGALLHLMQAGPTCPCGAWIGQENQRGHVLGCPVAPFRIHEGTGQLVDLESARRILAENDR